MLFVLPARHTTRLGIRLTLVAVALLAEGRAPAGITFYSDPAAFQQAAGNLLSINFEGVAPVNGIQDYGVNGTATFDDYIAFQATNGSLAVADGNYYQATMGTPFNFGSGAFLQVSGGNPAQLFVTGVGGLYAAGFDLATGDTEAASQVNVSSRASSDEPCNKIDDLVCEDVTAPQNKPAFFGFVSTDYVSSLTFKVSGGSQNSKLFLDSFQYRFSPIPEMPVSVGMAVMAVCSLLAWRRAHLRSASGSK